MSNLLYYQPSTTVVAHQHSTKVTFTSVSSVFKVFTIHITSPFKFSRLLVI